MEFERQRSEIVGAAFGMVAQNIEKAVTTLVWLLDSQDERVKHVGCDGSHQSLR